MSVQVRRRREAAAFLSSFVGAQGELIVDTTNNRVQVHDGATPGGFPAAKLADLVQRVAVADANYAAGASDRTVAFTAITAPRSVALPAASAYPTGTTLVIVDESGSCSSSNGLTIAAAGSDTINGSPSIVVGTAYGYLKLESNGANRWTTIGQPGAAGAAAASSGSTAPAANSVTNAMLAQMSALTLKVNIAASAASPTDSSFSAVADAVFGTTRGQILFRGASGWTALPPGAGGSVLTSGGSGSDPSYKAVPAQGPLNNVAATTFPAATNDASQGYAAGSLWLLPATAELYTCRDATTGAAVWTRADNADFFGYVANRWYVPMGTSATATGTNPGSGLIKLFPWINKQRVTLSALGVRIITVASGGNAQVALYANNPTTKRPTGTPLASTASLSTTTAGAVSAAVNVQIEPGLWWFAVNCDNTTTTFSSLANTSLNAQQLVGGTTEIAGTGYTAQPLAFNYTQPFGNWPDLTSATLTEAVTNAQTTAMVHFQVASVP